MAANIIGKSISNAALVSRFDQLACETSFLIDGTIHGGDTLPRGTLMGLLSSGKYRAYGEGTVSSAFSTASPNFTLNVASSPYALRFKVGDVIEDTAGNALGTIATYNATTGVGTLSGNSTSNLASNGKVRLAVANVALNKGQGKILKDEVSVVAGVDAVGVGFFEGFFIQANTTVTAAALAAMGGKTIDAGEIRIV